MVGNCHRAYGIQQITKLNVVFALSVLEKCSITEVTPEDPVKDETYFVKGKKTVGF